MEPLQIVLIVLALVGVWAVIELALTLRRARSTVSAIDKTLGDVQPVIQHIDSTVESAAPLVKKLEVTVDEIKPVLDRVNETLDGAQPAISQIEPLLKQGSIAVEALSADLIEVNGVLRDISDVTAGMSSASNAVSSMATAATERVHKFFGKNAEPPATGERTLTEQTGEPAADPHAEDQWDAADDDSSKRAVPQYYTYSDGSAPASAPSTQEDTNE